MHGTGVATRALRRRLLNRLDMGRVRGVVIGTTLALLLVGAASASAAETVVTPSSKDGWETQTNNELGEPVPFEDPTCHGWVHFVFGPGEPPLGVGSVELKTGNGTTG